jgi:hypothetical protein
MGEGMNYYLLDFYAYPFSKFQNLSLKTFPHP